MSWRCHYCQTSLSAQIVTKNRLCPTCGSDLHACKNCHFYNEDLSSKCSEPDSPWVRDRGSFNECTYCDFRTLDPKAGLSEKSAELASEAEKAKAAFRALFRTP